MRTVHGKRVGYVTRIPLEKWKRLCLINYFYRYTEPTLDQIESLAKTLGESKERIYWWFHNRRKRDRKLQKTKIDILSS